MGKPTSNIPTTIVFVANVGLPTIPPVDELEVTTTVAVDVAMVAVEV
jgi:hypothetical protein